MFEKFLKIRACSRQAQYTLTREIFSLFRSSNPVQLTSPFLLHYDNYTLPIYSFRSLLLDEIIAKPTKQQIMQKNISPCDLEKNSHERHDRYCHRVAKYYLATEHLDDALVYAKKYLTEAPCVDAFRLCSAIYIKQNNINAALEQLKAGMVFCKKNRVDDYFISFDFCLAQVYSGNLREATQSLSKFIAATPYLGQEHVLNFFSLRGITQALLRENNLAERDFSYVYSQAQQSSKIKKELKTIYFYNLETFLALSHPETTEHQEKSLALEKEISKFYDVDFKHFNNRITASH